MFNSNLLNWYFNPPPPPREVIADGLFGLYHKKKIKILCKIKYLLLDKFAYFKIN